MSLRVFGRGARSLLLIASAAVAATAQEAPKVSISPTVRVALHIDSTTTARFTARGFDFRVSRLDVALSAELQLVKTAGVHTGTLVSLSASGARVPTGVIEVLDSLGRTALTLRLTDVAIVSDQLSLSAARANIEAQRISQQEALSALTTDYQEAQRQLATAEELSKSRGSTRMDVARARDRATDLQRRIEFLKQRQAALASQAADAGPLDETIKLRFAKLEIESPEPGGRATIDVGTRPPPAELRR